MPNDIFIDCNTACGNPCDKKGNWIKLNPKTSKPFVKKGYDLNKKELSIWLSKKYPNKIKGKPRKLEFDLTLQREVFLLNFVSEVK